MKNSIFAGVLLLAGVATLCAGGSVPATPEPGTFIMLATAAAGGAGYAIWRKRKTK